MFQITFADRMQRMAHNTEEFALTTGRFPENVVADLLTDLRILCAVIDTDFDLASEQSRMHCDDCTATTSQLPENVMANLLTALRIWCLDMDVNFDVASEQSCMDAGDELELLGWPPEDGEELDSEEADPTAPE
jgi:hypothetical protein